ncbi:MAG TPA: tetratricopeptide repeat protein, partial [Oculatellaceae cyanobacterium]
TNNLIRVGEGEPITTPINTVEDANTIRERGRRRLQFVAGEIEWQSGWVSHLEEEDTLTNIGDIYKALGQYPAALKSYQEALAIVRQEMESEESKESKEAREQEQTIIHEGDYRKQEQRIFRKMGSVYEALGQYQAALESYQQSLAIANKGSSNLLYQTPILLTHIGKVYEQLGQYQAAIEPYQQALAIARKYRAHYSSQERMLRKYGQEQYLRRYRMVYEKPDEEALLNSIATIYEKLGQNQAAQEYRQQALAFRQEISNRTQEDVTPGKAILLTKMRTNERRRDETKKALFWVNRLEGEGVILFAAGNTLSVQEQYQAALQSYQQALAIVRQKGNRPWESVILNQMGSVYQKLGQNQAALESYQQALIIGQEMARSFEEKATFIGFSVGSTHYELQFRFESGQVITFNKVGGLIVEAEEREETLIETGNVYKALGQNQAALESYQQALAIVRNEEFKRREKEPRILERIGSVYDNLQYEDALKAYQQLLTTGLTYDQKNSVLNSIGTVYKNMGQYQAALESYNQALALVRDKQRYQYDAINAEGTILNNIGSVYEQLGQYSTALESYKQALAI